MGRLGGMLAYEFHGGLGLQGHRRDRSKCHQTIGWKYGVLASPYSSVLRTEKPSARL